MKEQEILKMALQKAKKNGWNRATNYADRSVGKLAFQSPEIIFNHEFAKSFWGEQEIRVEVFWDAAERKSTCGEMISWQYHLKIMVLKEEPLKYLEQFLTPQK